MGAGKGAEADWPLVCEAAATTNEHEFPLLHETYSLALKEARAAIEAMREPTKEMVVAGNDAAEDKMEMDGYESTGYYPVANPALAVTCLNAMIDAALNERVSR